MIEMGIDLSVPVRGCIWSRRVASEKENESQQNFLDNLGCRANLLLAPRSQLSLEFYSIHIQHYCITNNRDLPYFTAILILVRSKKAFLLEKFAFYDALD